MTDRMTALPLYRCNLYSWAQYLCAVAVFESKVCDCGAAAGASKIARIGPACEKSARRSSSPAEPEMLPTKTECGPLMPDARRAGRGSSVVLAVPRNFGFYRLLRQFIVYNADPTSKLPSAESNENLENVCASKKHAS